MGDTTDTIEQRLYDTEDSSIEQQLSSRCLKSLDGCYLIVSGTASYSLLMLYHHSSFFEALT